jgi:hypothetical protein
MDRPERQSVDARTNAVAGLCRIVAAQGRSARIHLLAVWLKTLGSEELGVLDRACGILERLQVTAPRQKRDG